jgi:hypothetical protein
MKGIICAGLVASLQWMSVAQAYEADIHYSTTYVLARAVGWTGADARIIASANQGLDENQHTVAALEMESTPSQPFTSYVASSLRQAGKNLQFHCFGTTHPHGSGIAADVLEVMAERFAAVPEEDDDPRSNTTRLIALGAALHCQQDAHSHADFGGSCGSHAGSCLGHTTETFLDQVVFGLLKKHYFNPDHPAVSGERLLEALQGTVRELAAHRPRKPPRSITAQELAALSDALRASGLELPDDVRLVCNRHLAGKWLFDFLQARGRTVGPNALDTLAPEVAGTCRNPSLGAATIVRIPVPRYPRLNPDASPSLVKADGTYQLVPAGDLDAPSPGMGAAGTAALIANYGTRKLKFQLSHWTHLLALPRMARVAQLPTDSQTR